MCRVIVWWQQMARWVDIMALARVRSWSANANFWRVKNETITMEITNLLEFTSRSELRQWLYAHHATERECWVVMTRSKQPIEGVLPYLDVVEESLCFGWIDSTLKRLPNGHLAQRLSPRRKRSHWTELNIERCADLERRGLMTDAGRKALNEALQRIEVQK